jgi:ubiquinone/menaquinone biosynthesis C-methylase UbiE
VSDAVVVQAFTELAPHYEETVDWEVREFCGLGYRELIRHLAASVPVTDGQVILDVASGTAVSSVEIARRIGLGCQVVGLDITPAMMAYGAENIAAEELGSRIHQVCGSGMQIPLSADSLDVVICGLGTHHMDVPRLLAEIKRVLKDGGRLVMADVGAPAYWRSIWGRTLMWGMIRILRTFWRGARVQAETDAMPSLLTAAEWRDLLVGSGFGSVEIVEWPPRRFYYPCVLIVQTVVCKDA